MFKIIRGCIRCDKVNRWKTWILSFSCFHQTVTGSLTCRKKTKFENWTSSLSLWFKWELSLCASRWNTKRTLGPYFLNFIYSYSSFQRHQGQSFEKETIYHCIRLCHNKYAVSKFLDIIFDEFSKSQPDLVINVRFFHSDGTPQEKYPLCTMMLIQHLKYKFCLCRSFDHYNTDPGSQATYHNGHKVAFFLWPKWIRTVECAILVIKKTYVRSLQIRLYPVFLNMPMKPVSCIL